MQPSKPTEPDSRARIDDLRASLDIPGATLRYKVRTLRTIERMEAEMKASGIEAAVAKARAEGQ